MRSAIPAGVALLLIAALLAGVDPVRAAAAANLEPAPPLLPPLAHAPLAGPLRVTGTFGELRGGHFHGGVDFSTGGVVGRPVYAALSGFIERVRTSGGGYGRSLYLHARDGRLLVYAHLEQFRRPIAEYAAAFQDSTGVYEQDLWPDSARFRIEAGELLGWSGRSGTLPPHLHFEVRRGDVAYNPLRAGVALLDTVAPVIRRVTLEPLDDTSLVNGSAAPYTLDAGGRPDTVVLQGRARAIAEVTDGTDGARRTMAPWAVALESGAPDAPGATRLELRFDRASWATDMSEVDYLYDRGRITDAGRFSLMLWAPREFRPVVMDAPAGAAELGTLALAGGESVRPVRIVARDVAGHATVRAFVLRAPRAEERAAAESPGSPAERTANAGGGEAPSPSDSFDFVALPDRHLRVLYRGAPSGSRRVWFEAGRGDRRAARAAPGPAGSGTVWTAMLPDDALRAGTGLTVRVSGEDGRGKAWSATSPEYQLMALEPGAGAETPAGSALEWRAPAGAAFERDWAVVLPAVTVPATGELAARGPMAAVLPTALVLRRPAKVSLPLPAAAAPDHVALFQWDGSEWDFLGRDFDPAQRRMSAESRNGGAFALLEDTAAPRIIARRPRRHPALKPYSRWALEAVLEDDGAGVDRTATHFVVDGRVRPSEWDGEVKTLRWRPLQRPARGRHTYEIVAVDRTGNLARRTGTFVID